MRALSITSKGVIKLIQAPVPKVGAGNVLIRVSAAALNKRDQFIREGKYPNIKLESILGSDAVGEVVGVGTGLHKKNIGRKVIINPNVNWGDNEDVQSRDYTILGMPSNGTFAEFVEVAFDRIHDIPNHLKDEEAAALTAFRACFKQGNIKQGDNVMISGFGGGVAQFAFQFAIAVGANVYVTSSSESKINRAVEMGAKAGFNYNDPNWHKNLWQTKGGFDVVIDSAGGDQINTFVKLMRPAGRIVFYGATNGLPSSLDLYRMFWNQITLQGTTMGSDKEFEAMLAFVNKHEVVPIVDTIMDFEHIIEAFNEIAGSSKIGKVVVKL